MLHTHYYYLKWKKETRYTDRDWTLEEKVAFEDAISTHGAELRAVRDDVGSRSIYEVVRYYAHWKKYYYLRLAFSKVRH